MFDRYTTGPEHQRPEEGTALTFDQPIVRLSGLSNAGRRPAPVGILRYAEENRVPRQTRRARMQTAGRKRTTPLIPRHLLDRSGPATLEPPSSDDVDLETLETAPEMASAPLIERKPAPAPPSAFIRRATVEKPAAASPARLASTDYGYVVGELKRIFLTAAIIVVLLIVVALLRR